MNVETFVEWLRRRGHNVFKTPSSYWYDAGPRILQAFPYHCLIKPSNEEIRSLLIKERIVALRYSSPLDTPVGKLSYHIVLNKSYDISLLNRKTRNGVKRGLDHFGVEPISFNRLARDGWFLQQDTLKRQKRQSSMSKSEWETLCISAKDLPGFEVFAAVTGGELAAAAIVCRIDDTFCVPFAMSHSSFLGNHVNNALFYSMSYDLLKRDNMSGIFFTVESLDAPPHVDEFKVRMGFEPKPVRQVVAIHPYVRPFVTQPIYGVARRLSKRYPYSSHVSKTEGMMRFYLEGKRPLQYHTIPGFLKTKIEQVDILN